MTAVVDSVKDYQFFLSYSRRDALEHGKTENVWFTRFRNDLMRDVAREAKLPTTVMPEDVGFYDRDGIKTGDRWSAALSDALRASRSLVSVYSQNYFASEYCGKEFSAFGSRVQQHEAVHGPAARGFIIPVLWDPPTKLPAQLPASVLGLQFEHATLGALYAEKGLMFLLRMQEEKAYQQFLLGISELIAEAGRQILTPAPIGPLSHIESAFHIAPTQPPTTDVPAVKGVKAAWLVYVAGAQADYLNIKPSRDAYGSSASEWQPYLPSADTLIGAIASHVASGSNLSPAPLAVTSDLVARLHEAEDNNTMAVVIVDPWSIAIKSFENAMRDLDRARLTNCGVIIVWNSGDEDTQREARALDARLKKTFSRIWTSKDIYFRRSVPTETDLREALRGAIEEIRRRIRDRGKLLRGESADDELPKLPTGGSTAAVES